MKVKYCVSENELETEDGRRIPTYGIYALSAGGDCRTLDELRDVSTDSAFTYGLAELLNYYEVELCHFRDVVLDELNR